MMEWLEERIALTINYAIAPGTTLDIFPISSIIPAAPAGMDRMEVLFATIPGVSHGTMYRVSGLSAYPWGSGAPNVFTVGAGNDRIFGGEGFRYVNNGTGNGTSESIPIKFRDSTGFNTLTDTIVIKIDANLVPPTITTQPNPFIQIPPGGSASMSVVASGDAPITYQWYTGFVPDTSNPIAGATFSSYTTPTLSIVQQYHYWVRVTNSGGHADSDGVTVQVATPTSVITSNVSTTFKTTAHAISLNATVTPALNVGNVTFSSLALGGAMATSATIVNGLTGNTAFTIPAGATVGDYAFQAHYQAPAGTADSFDNKTITITKADTTTAATNKNAVASGAAQAVSLSATVSSAAGPVNEGTVTFTLLDGANTIGVPVTSATVANGAAGVNYTLPANSRAGVYTIKAVYNAGSDYNPSNDSAHTLTESPVITSNAAARPANTTAVVVNGFGFDTTLANDVITFPAGVTGSVTGATANQLTIGSLTGLVAGSLNFSVTVRGVSSGAAVQVATIIPFVSSNSASLNVTATTMTIAGVGFSSTPANNTVSFSNGVTGTVTAATRTLLTLSSLSGLKVGALNASVTSNAQSSGAAVQVATVIPVVSMSAPALPATTTTLTIAGFGFDTTFANDTVTLSGGATGTVTAATATQLTVSSVSGLIAGPLTASVIVDGVSSGAGVQVATISPVVTVNTAPIGPNTTSLKINGFGFANANAANSVTFFPGCAGSITTSSPTQLTFTFSSPPPAASLTAVVTSNGVSSGNPVQVATYDAAPPTAGSGKLNLDAPSFATLSIQMSEAIPLPLLLSHLSVDAVGAPALNYIPSNVSQDPVSHVATFSFASLFANRNYHATLSAAGLTDIANNPMAANYGFDFYFLDGDANRDRSVGFPDLVTVAQHYTQSSVTYANGDLNGDNTVNFADLVILAQNYGGAVPVPAPAVPATLDPAMSAASASSPLDPVRSKSIFSVVPVSKPVRANAKPVARKDGR
jgi:hypothetical protein